MAIFIQSIHSLRQAGRQAGSQAGGCPINMDIFSCVQISDWFRRWTLIIEKEIAILWVLLWNVLSFQETQRERDRWTISIMRCGATIKWDPAFWDVFILLHHINTLRDLAVFFKYISYLLGHLFLIIMTGFKISLWYTEGLYITVNYKKDSGNYWITALNFGSGNEPIFQINLHTDDCSVIKLLQVSFEKKTFRSLSGHCRPKTWSLQDFLNWI